MDGLVLLDAATSRPILRSAFANRDPSYPPAIADAVAASVSRAKAAGTTPDPVIWLAGVGATGSDAARDGSDSEDDEQGDGRVFGPSHSDRKTQGRFCCHALCGSVRLACGVVPGVEASVPFALLSAFGAVLLSYFKAVTPGTIQDNFDIVLQLIDTCLSAASTGADGGFGPTTTEQGTLKDVVVAPGLVARMMAAVGAAGIGPGSGPSVAHPFSSSLPWRPNGIRYQSNEIYIDICERVSAILDRSGTPIVSSIAASLHCKSKLSGTPDLVLSFVDPTGIANPTFHPCVRYSKWAASRVLSFVPPDGRSTLMTFHVGPLPGDLQAAKLGLRRRPLVAAVGGSPMPVALKPIVTVGRAGGSFSFTLRSLLPASVAFSHVEISWRLGPVDGVAASVTGGKLPFAPGQGGAERQRESGGGDWSWDADAGLLKWRLERVSAMERESKLSGTWRSAGSLARPAPAVAVDFEVQSFSLTGIRVDRLKLAGGESTGASMFKGVRSQVRSGKVEVRW